MSFLQHIKQHISHGAIIHVGGYNTTDVDDYVALAADLQRDMAIIGPFLEKYDNTEKDKGCYNKIPLTKQEYFIKKYPKVSIIKDDINNFCFRLPHNPALIHITAINYLTMKSTLVSLHKHIINGSLTIIPFNGVKCGKNLAVVEFLSTNKIKFNIISKHVIINYNTSVDNSVDNSVDTSVDTSVDNSVDTSIVSCNTNSEPEEIIIATVLKSGGIYTPEYANNLANGIKNYSSIPHKLVCLTDFPKDDFSDNFDEIIPFEHHWAKWWGKIELFKHTFYYGKRIVYFDMDTIICNNIDWLLNYTGPFMALLDFYTKSNIGSAVMSWKSGEYSHVYDNFYVSSKSVMSSYIQGDQRWIGEQIPKPQHVQSKFPKRVVSFKADCIKKKTYSKTDNIIIPHDCSVICFHGEPRIHSIENEIIKNLWSGSGSYKPLTPDIQLNYSGNGIEFGKVKIDVVYKNIIIVGSGKSLEQFNFDSLRSLSDTCIISVNGSGQFVPFAQIWFTLDPWGLTTTQCPYNFTGMKYAAVPDDYGTAMARQKDHKVIARGDITYLHRLTANNYSNKSSLHAYKLGLSEDKTCISTGNSGYGALNLAYHMRPQNIILLGIDAGNGYFYDSKTTNGPLDLLPLLFESSIPQLYEANISVYNGSPISKIECFAKYDPTEIVQKIKDNQL